MVIRVVKLGSPRIESEGPRIGTVRRPPRGVPKSEFASQNWYDVWFPNLPPSAETMKLGQQAETPAEWLAVRLKTGLRSFGAEQASEKIPRLPQALVWSSAQKPQPVRDNFHCTLCGPCRMLNKS